MGIRKRLAYIGISSAIFLGLIGCGSAADLSSGQTTSQSAVRSKTIAAKASGESEYPEDDAEKTGESDGADAENGEDDIKEESVTEEDGVTEDSEENGEDSIIGRCKNGVYENAFFGIGCKLEGKDWEFKSEEELQQYDQASAESMGFKNLKEALENGAIYTDMLAYDQDGCDSLRVTIKKQNSGIVHSERAYIENASRTLPLYLKQMGATDIKTDIVTVNVFGEEHKALVVSLKVDNIPMYEAEVCLIREGYTITCGAAVTESEEAALELLNCYYSVDGDK